LAVRLDLALISPTSILHRIKRISKKKTFSPYLEPRSKSLLESVEKPQSASKHAETLGNIPYRESVHSFMNQRIVFDKKREAKKQETRLKKQELRKMKREARIQKKRLKNELNLKLEEGQALKSRYLKRMEDYKERMKHLRAKRNNNPPQSERKEITLDILVVQEDEKRSCALYLAERVALEKTILFLKDQIASFDRPGIPVFQGPVGYIPILLIVDDHDRFLYPLCLLENSTSEEIIAILDQYLPSSVEFIITDNGTQFISDIFESWLKEDNREHVRTYPHHPQENGRVERQVRSVKDALELHDWTNRDEFRSVLWDVRDEINNTPHSALRYQSPARYHAQNCEAS
jgi:transposase InsO family protein